MDYGLHFMSFSLPGGAPAMARVLSGTARTAEEAGATWFTVMDHYFQMEPLGGPAAPMLEGYTSLGYLAGQTRELQLGLLVTGVTYRHPGLLAKIVSTLDVLSGGRAMLGIGAAWYEREHEGLGVPYPPLGERFERLEETLQIVKQMWSENDGPYEGTHYQLAETINLPQTIQSPPPIVIGGLGEKKTLRLVAQYGDACNFFAIGPDAIKAKLEILDQHCDTVGRDSASIQKTILSQAAAAVADPDAFLAEMEQYAALGIDHVHLMLAGPDPVDTVARVAETVAPRLKDIRG
jgi:F420-dependent oxidoreductase-like protein